MRLLVIRHGEAEPIKTTDANRALTAKGREDAAALGRYIQSFKLGCRLCLVSPYVRARETLDNILQAGDLTATIVVAEGITPDDPVRSAYLALSAYVDAEAIMIVSHLPLVSRLIASLVDGTESTANQYPMYPASMAILEMDVLAPGQAMLKQLLSPPY